MLDSNITLEGWCSIQLSYGQVLKHWISCYIF